MKKMIKVFLIVILLVSLLGINSNVFAEDETTSPLKIEIITDEEEYDECSIAKIDVIVTNISNGTIHNISAEAIFDELLPVKSESEIIKEIESLSPNESFSFSYYVTINSDKFDLSTYEKVVLELTRLTNGGFEPEENEFDNGREHVEYTQTINFGRFEANNIVKVWYGEIYVEDYMTIDQSNFETTEVLQTLTGEILFEESIERIWYTVESEYGIDEYENISYDEGTWATEVFQLRPGENKITAFAKTEDNTYCSNSINVDYDTGKGYELDVEYIAYDEDEDTYYTNNIVIINFESGVTEARRNEIVESINGEVVGRINVLDEFHVEISPRSLSELEKLCTALEEYEEVSVAYADYITKVEETASSNDSSTIDYRWHLKYIEAIDAWNYTKQYSSEFSRVNIGIIDLGFSNHDDLNITILNSNNGNSVHGTQVAGVLGGDINTEERTGGVIQNANLYGYVVNKSTWWEQNVRYNSTTKVSEGLSKLVETNCKVINVSLGADTSEKYSDETLLSNSQIKKQGKTTSQKIAKLLEKGYDFVVVQSAGNGAKVRADDGGKVGVDAIYNGYFASITEENCFSNKNISKDEVMNRVIIVTSTNNYYTTLASSNIGEQVDIAAPGVGIRTTTSNNSYASVDGTSVASPIVAGVAGLVWSTDVNGLTGAKVKDILLASCSQITKSRKFK